MSIGVISDTHNYLDPRVLELFTGVEHILHAGDVGQPSLLLELEQLAPVTAVGGNTDDPGWRYRLTQTLELAGRKFLLHHIVDPLAPSEEVQDLVLRERPQVVVFGHTHKPFAETSGGILYFNPGYAGKSRFGMPRTVARLHCEKDGLRPEFIAL